MLNKAFQRLISQIEKLTPTQLKRLKNQIYQKCSIKTIEDTIEKTEHCPHCDNGDRLDFLKKRSQMSNLEQKYFFKNKNPSQQDRQRQDNVCG